LPRLLLSTLDRPFQLSYPAWFFSRSCSFALKKEKKKNCSGRVSAIFFFFASLRLLAAPLKQPAASPLPPARVRWLCAHRKHAGQRAWAAMV
jgi:hypothetical protein